MNPSRPSTSRTKSSRSYTERDALLVAASSPSSWGAIAGAEIATERQCGSDTEIDGDLTNQDINKLDRSTAETDGEDDEGKLKGWRLGITL